MAYGLKYELLCTTRKGNLYSVKLLFDGYIGDPIDRNIPVPPFFLKKDKAAVVRGTSFDYKIREEVDFEFLEFYSNNNKFVKVELYDPYDNLIWKGYNLPQQYQVPYTPPPASVSFTATDGLGLLKLSIFTLTGIASQLDVIRYCIDKIGLELGYSIVINIFEVTHDHTRSPLAQTYENTEIFEGMDCYTVLEKILNKYDAEITQVSGRWAIISSKDKKSTRMLYSSTGIYEGTESGPIVLNIDLPNAEGVDVWPKNSLEMGIEPGGKQVKLSQRFGTRQSILTNADFAAYSNGLFNNWAKTESDTNLTCVQKYNYATGNYYMFIPGSTGDQIGFYQEIEVEKQVHQKFCFSALVAGSGYNAASPQGYDPARVGVWGSTSMTIRMKVVLVGTSASKYLSKKGWVDDSNQRIDVQVDSSWESALIIGLPDLTNGFNEIKIITDELPFSGTLVITLYKFDTASHDYITYYGVAFSNINITFLLDGRIFPDVINTRASFDDSTEINSLEDIEILSADALTEVANITLIYKNLTRLVDNSLTTLWHILGSSATYPLLQMLGLIIASNRSTARQKLTGEIKGTGIKFDSIIKHTFNNNREFEIAEAVWNIYEETFNVTLLELFTWSDQIVTFAELIDSESSGLGNASGGTGSSYSTSFGGSVNITTEMILARLKDILEVVDGAEGEYIRFKFGISCDYGIRVYSDNGQFPPSIWEAMPHAAVGTYGSIQLDGVSSTKFLRGDGTWQTVAPGSSYTFQHSIAESAGAVNLVNDSASPGNNKMYGTNGSGARGWYDVPSSMVYPGAGIPLSTGSAWGTSITDNSGNWNTAYGWGNHSGLYLGVALKGAANGVAELDSGGRVPSAQLPSYVDDVVEAANYEALPETGETGKIYVTLDDNLTYRWSGSAYVEISASLALGETSSTAYRGDRGKTAYDFSQAHLTDYNHGNIAHGETAYGWGNHASAGYAPLASPVFTGSGSWDSPTFVVDATNHRVGFGAVAPQRLLHLYGGADSYARFDTNIADKANWTIGADAYGFIVYEEVADAYRLVVQKGGNIGAGIVVPDANLHVASSVRIGATNSTHLRFSTDELAAWNNGVVSTLYLNYAGGNVNLGNGKVVMLTGGDFGIGITPTEKLHVAGNVLATGSIKGASLKTANYSLEESSGNLVIKYGSTIIARLSSTGTLLTAAGMGTYQAI